MESRWSVILYGKQKYMSLFTNFSWKFGTSCSSEYRQKITILLVALERALAGVSMSLASFAVTTSLGSQVFDRSVVRGR